MLQYRFGRKNIGKLTAYDLFDPNTLLPQNTKLPTPSKVVIQLEDKTKKSIDLKTGTTIGELIKMITERDDVYLEYKNLVLPEEAYIEDIFAKDGTINLKTTNREPQRYAWPTHIAYWWQCLSAPGYIRLSSIALNST